MTIPLLVLIDPETVSAKGLNLQQISYLGACLVTASPANIDKLTTFIRKNFALLAIYVDVRQLKSWNDVVELLNVGASKVWVTFEQLKQLALEPTIEVDRLVLTISPSNPQTDLTKLGAFLESDARWKTSEWAFDGDKGKDYIDDVLKALSNYPANKDQVIYVTVAGEAGGVDDLLHKYPGDTLVLPSERLCLDESDGQISVTSLLLAGASADRSTRLYATSVIDERGTALGLVWSSPASITESLKTGAGVYQSRKRGLWHKGATSGDTQELISLNWDCDKDCLLFRVRQKGRGFCHRATTSCWGPLGGLSKLEKTLKDRKRSAPEGSYTARLFNDAALVRAKIKEEADELCEAQSKEDIAAEAADLLYFALTKCIAADVSLEEIETNLDLKSLKVKRRKGDAKPEFEEKQPVVVNGSESKGPEVTKMKRLSSDADPALIREALQRPSQRSTESIMSLVQPIIAGIRSDGDAALLKYTAKFDKATLSSPVQNAPFPPELMTLSASTKSAIDISFSNIHAFHLAQQSPDLSVTTMPGVTCSRFARPIERVGLYIPGGTAVLPSTALMLGIPALIAGCSTIVIATPPRPDGSIAPEIVYIAFRIGCKTIVLAGGAQAVAALAYGTASVPKVDKILGPGNQFVTAAKMLVSNDTSAAVAIDMPAGPSEVLVIADKTANAAFVAADLLSQAEHGVDSQVVLITIDLNETQLSAIETELTQQTAALPRVEIAKAALSHSLTLTCPDLPTALALSNQYAPEHLILQISSPRSSLPHITNAGSVFIGPWTPESVGDYSAGVNHSLPTYGYARQYSGVNLGSFVKYVTSSECTKEGLRGIGERWWGWRELRDWRHMLELWRLGWWEREGVSEREREECWRGGEKARGLVCRWFMITMFHR